MAARKSLVTIVITCYNYANFISKAIESALDQTHENVEVIVIDDGSSDDSLNRIKAYDDKVQIISRSNKGIVYTRNEGLAAASGEYVLFLDADNYLPENYVKDNLKFLEDHSLDIVYTDMIVFGGENYKSQLPTFDLELLKISNYIDINSLMKKKATNGVEFDPVLNDLSHEDWDFFLTLALKGKKIAKNPNSIFYYQVHQSGKSRNNDRKRNPNKYIKMYDYVFKKHAEMQYGYIADLLDYTDQKLKLLNALQARFAQHQTEIDSIRNSLDYANYLLESTQKELLSIRQSKTWRTAQFITAPIRFLRRIGH